MKRRPKKAARKKLSDFPKIYRDALAYWCAFRNLGFEAAEIYLSFGVVNGLPDILFLQLQTQGKTFTATVGQLPGAKESHVHDTWKAIAETANTTASSEERNACVREHALANLEYYTLFVNAIHKKGIIVPELVPYSENKA